MAKQPKIEIVDSRGEKFRVRYIGKNGEILAVSEPLETKKNCNVNIKAMSNCLIDWSVSNIEIQDKTKKKGKASHSKG
jgi:uncharacterized protein YegP (UPF0339 family)